MLVFVCGPHSAGKTTIISRLKSRGVVSTTGDEIGKQLFYERGFQTGIQGPEFEHEVVDLELKRDIEFAGIKGIKVVETWHPGNLAYSAVRNPPQIAELSKRCATSHFIDKAYGFYLKIPKEMIAMRTRTFTSNRQWAQEFYAQIDRQIPIMLDLLGLTARTIVVDASRSLDNVYDEVEHFVCALPHQDALPK